MKKAIIAAGVVFFITSCEPTGQLSISEKQHLAEQGDVDAQYDLGDMYYDRDGIMQDYVEAAKWYRKAADQGDASAQYNLGKV